MQAGKLQQRGQRGVKLLLPLKEQVENEISSLLHIAATPFWYACPRESHNPRKTFSQSDRTAKKAGGMPERSTMSAPSADRLQDPIHKVLDPALCFHKHTIFS